ncbi:MAG: cyclic nucleotide-binding domain-containing protein [Cyanobacteria bacterium P01_G01_bin.54]
MDIQPDLLTYEAGAIVFREGDQANRFYMVLEGRVEAYHGSVQQRRVLNTMERGQYFGEIGLLDPNSKRSASIRITDDTPAKLMTIKREDFRKLMQGSNLTEMAIAQTLQERMNRTVIAEALPTLEMDIVQEILPQIERLKYGPGSNLVNVGDLPKYFFIVAVGQVEAIVTDAEGQQCVVATLGPGEYFGEIGLLEQRPRTATVRANPQTTVEVIALPRAVFQHLMEASQVTHEEIARMIYERLKKKN